jgi:hypothetical protein
MTFSAKYPFLDTTNDFTPINDLQVVVPNDSADLPNGISRAVIFTGTGSIKITTSTGTVITLPISANWFGVTYLRIARIWATGTTISAGNIFVGY